MAGLFRIWIFKVFFLGLIDPSQASLRPRVSFSWGSSERLLGIYLNSTVKNATTLLLSTDADTLFVGAQDALLSLDVSQPDSITLKDKMEWKASRENLLKCKMASKKDCGNYISILQFFNSTHLYACGTNAYGPQGIIIRASALKGSKDTMNAKNCCPYSSTQRNTAIVVDEELYTATKVGFFGDKKVISRCHSRGTRNNLELEIVPKLLQDPVFISSTNVASEGKILLFFTEVGDLTGDSLVNSFIVSRVAQVCTDDNGGSLTLQKRWTSFAKAQLVCQQGEDLQFNMLQDIVKLSPPDNQSPDSTLFYGVFTSQWSVSTGQSAVCAFKLADIKAAFSGGYKTFDLEGNHWSRQPNVDGKLGKCGLFNDTDQVLNIVKKSFLAEKTVRSGKKLLLSSTEENYIRLAVQRTQAANGQSYTILYLLTESGFLHKVVLLAKGPHIIEEIQTFKQPHTVKNILLSKSKGVLFIGSSEGVFRVPVSNCSAYPNCAECVLARDPFCGWDSETSMCAAVSGMRSNLRQDVESGNVNDQCKEFKNTAALVTRIGHLNEIMVLPCQSRSRLAEVTWRFLNNSVVPQFPYLQRADGSLFFPVTPETVNTYHCMSKELGFEEIVAAFAVIFPVIPRSLPPPSRQQPDVNLDTEVDPIPDYYTTEIDHSDSEPTKNEKTNAFMTPDRSGKIQPRTNREPTVNINTSGEETVCISQKSYYSEMVAFCLLFVICLFVFIAFVILWRQSMRCNKTAPQKQAKDTESDNIWQTELEEKQS